MASQFRILGCKFAMVRQLGNDQIIYFIDLHFCRGQYSPFLKLISVTYVINIVVHLFNQLDNIWYQIKQIIQFNVNISCLKFFFAYFQQIVNKNPISTPEEETVILVLCSNFVTCGQSHGLSKDSHCICFCSSDYHWQVLKEVSREQNSTAILQVIPVAQISTSSSLTPQHKFYET